MKHLARTIAIASIAALFAMSSTADAKSSRKHKSKKAKASKVKAKKASTAASDIPWYEQGIADLAPAPKVKAKTIRVESPRTMTLGFETVGRHQNRRTQAPSGLCKEGCDKTKRNINMATLVMVKDKKARKKSKKVKTRKRAASQLDVAIIVSHR